MADVTIEDLREPLELAAGDLVGAGGLDRVMARALRLLFMRPGELLHRPDYGADLSSFRGKPATPGVIDQIRNAIARGLALLPEIESWEAEINAGETLMFTLSILANGERFTVRDVRI